MFDHGGSVHMMAFVRVPQSCVTRAPRNARSINTQTHANLIKKQRLYRMPNVGGQSCIFYRGFNSLWISSERGFPIVRQVTPTDVMSDISSEINASAAAEAAAMNNPSSPRTPALPTTDTLATVCAFHHKSVCVRGAVLVTPDGTTTICGIGKDDTGNNAEQEDEFVKEGLSVDRLRLGCTVHAVQEVPPPLKVDEEDDKLEDKINGVVQDKAEAVQSAKLSRLYVTIVSQDVAVPSSTSKQAEARQEHVYRLKAEEKGEFYVPRGEVPKFVSEKDLDEMGGKPPVVEPRYSVRLMALKRENDEDGDDSTLDASVADEYPLELFEHGTVITSVRLFDEAPPANFSSARAKVPASSPARKRIELRGRQFVAVGTALCPFDGEQARSGGRVLLFKVNRKMAKLELVSLLRLADPVMGIVQVAIPSRDISRTRTARAGGGSGDPSYDCGGFMLVARGRIIDTFRFLRAPDVDPNDEQKNVDPKTGRLAVVETDGTGTNKATIAAIAAARASGGGRKAIDAAKSNAITSAQLTKNGNFYNAQLFVHSLAILSDQYLLVADAYQSVQFVRWIPDKLSLSKLASDLDGPLEPYACEFLVTGNHVGMVVCDSAQNIRVFQYAPTDKQSYQLANIEAGRQANFDLRLNCTSSFHLGKNCVSLSRHRLLRDSAGRSQGEHGDDSQNAVEFASLVSTTDGAAGVMCPIPPATYKRLLALQQVMTYSLPHACGLNPLEYRAAAKHPAGIWKESVRRLRHVLFPVVDGNLVEEFLSLDATKQSDLARSIGTSSERIIEELRNVNSLSWLFC
jgi:cleavage and polyadenylation specificity factor subunit 1